MNFTDEKAAMRRNDGQRKLRALRTMPKYTWGFRSHPATQGLLHPVWAGEQTSHHWQVASLFAGCGGLDLGLTGGFRYLDQEYERLPFDIVQAIDNDVDAVETYRINLGDHIKLGDLSVVSARDIVKADVLIGGFPCQDFSSAGTKKGLEGERGELYKAMSNYMAHHRPYIVIGENVPHLARLRNGIYLETILKDFEAQGYRFDVWDLYAPSFGLPQSRRRLFLIGVRNDLPGYPACPSETHRSHRHVTTRDALRDLEEVTDESVTNQSQLFVATRASAGGGQGDHVNKADDVAYCIRANPRGRVQFHYRLNRRLTVRECARLQAFPDEFVFPFSTQRNIKLIGNAVPPILAHHIGRAVSRYLGSVTRRDGTAMKVCRNGIAVERARPIQQSLFAL